MKISRRQAYIATICYADIFHFPLTKEELARWLVFFTAGNQRLSIPKEIERRQKYFVLPKRASVVVLRERRESLITEKMRIAREMAHLLKFIPTIQLVGVTGGLSMGNADAEDDIDFFLITAPGTVWVSRIMATIVIELSGRRRHPGEKQVKNTICLNMYMDEDSVALSKSDQDLFSAHEVLQLMPLWNRNMTYDRFIHAKSWSKKYVPNAWKEKNNARQSALRNNKSPADTERLSFWVTLCRLLEVPCKFIQQWYMRTNRTNEVVTDTVIRFHPRDARIWIRESLKKRLDRYKIPLDKVFYTR